MRSAPMINGYLHIKHEHSHTCIATISFDICNLLKLPATSGRARIRSSGEEEWKTVRVGTVDLKSGWNGRSMRFPVNPQGNG